MPRPRIPPPKAAMEDGKGTTLTGSALIENASTARAAPFAVVMSNVMIVVLSPVQDKVPRLKSPLFVVPTPLGVKVRPPVRLSGFPMLKLVRNSSLRTRETSSENSVIVSENSSRTEASSSVTRSRNDVDPKGWVVVELRVTSTPPTVVTPPNGVPEPNSKSDVTVVANPAAEKDRKAAVARGSNLFSILKNGLLIAFLAISPSCTAAHKAPLSAMGYIDTKKVKVVSLVNPGRRKRCVTECRAKRICAKNVQ